MKCVYLNSFFHSFLARFNVEKLEDFWCLIFFVVWVNSGSILIWLIFVKDCDPALWWRSLFGEPELKIFYFAEIFGNKKTVWRKNLIKLCFISMWYGEMDCSRSSEPLFGTLFLLFTSICPPRKILMLWSLKISPCILKCSGIFKLSETFEFSLLPVSWFADFSWFSSTIKDSYNSTVEPYFLNKLT